MVRTEPLGPAITAAYQKGSTGGGGQDQASTKGEKTEIVWSILRYTGIGTPNRNLLYLRLLRRSDVLRGLLPVVRNRLRYILDGASQTVASDAVAISIQTIGISWGDLDRTAKVRAVEIRSRRGWSR
ncbi:hypothetical protein [Arthrobacter monumenti]